MYILWTKKVRRKKPLKYSEGMNNVFFFSFYFSRFLPPIFLHWRYISYCFLKFWVIILSQFSSVVSYSLRPHESQHARPPCPSPTPGVYSNSCPSSWWCHPAISSSVIPFSSCPQSLPASESFPVSQLFASGGQSTGVLTLASFLPKKSQGISFRMDWLDLLAVKGTLRSLL